MPSCSAVGVADLQQQLVPLDTAGEGDPPLGLFPDEWYVLFVEAANELGLITGFPDGTFRFLRWHSM